MPNSIINIINLNNDNRGLLRYAASRGVRSVLLAQLSEPLFLRFVRFTRFSCLPDQTALRCK